MRIRDWSSDVCSSDLAAEAERVHPGRFDLKALPVLVEDQPRAQPAERAICVALQGQRLTRRAGVGRRDHGLQLVADDADVVGRLELIREIAAIKGRFRGSGRIRRQDVALDHLDDLVGFVLRHPVAAVAEHGHAELPLGEAGVHVLERFGTTTVLDEILAVAAADHQAAAIDEPRPLFVGGLTVGEGRSEERSVGKECVSTCRSRWSPYHYKQTTYSNTSYEHPHS